MWLFVLAPVLAGTIAPVDAQEQPRPVAIKLRFAAYATDAAVTLGAARAPNAAQVDEAWLALKNLRFVSQTSCRKAAATPDIKGPISVETVTGKSTGMPTTLKVAAGRYCRLEASFYRADASDGVVPSDLRGASILVRGRRADGVPFVLRSRRTDLLSLYAAKPEGFALTDDPNRIFLALDVSRLLGSVDLFTAQLDGEARGRIIEIDDHSNPDLLAGFERAFASGVFLFRDRDGDRTLSADERDERHPMAAGR